MRPLPSVSYIVFISHFYEYLYARLPASHGYSLMCSFLFGFLTSRPSSSESNSLCWNFLLKNISEKVYFIHRPTWTLGNRSSSTLKKSSLIHLCIPRIHQSAWCRQLVSTQCQSICFSPWLSSGFVLTTSAFLWLICAIPAFMAM